MLPHPITFDVVVVADSSTDRTAQIASEMLGRQGTVLNAQVRTAGDARALAFRCAWRAIVDLCSDGGSLTRMRTALFPGRWLTDQRRLASEGIEAIAGTVSVDSFAEHGPEAAERFRASYTCRPDGSHPHIHGANLGVRADAYLRAGGWTNLRTAEDHAVVPFAHLAQCDSFHRKNRGRDKRPANGTRAKRFRGRAGCAQRACGVKLEARLRDLLAMVFDLPLPGHGKIRNPTPNVLPRLDAKTFRWRVWRRRI